jgi:hypothetical protein
MEMWQECLLDEVLDEAKNAIGNDAPDALVEAAAHHVLNAHRAQPDTATWSAVPEELSALAASHGYVVLTLVQGEDFELHLIEKLTRESPYVEILRHVPSGDPFENIELPQGVVLNTVGDLVNFMSDTFRLVPCITTNNLGDLHQIVKDLKLHSLVD